MKKLMFSILVLYSCNTPKKDVSISLNKGEKIEERVDRYLQELSKKKNDFYTNSDLIVATLKDSVNVSIIYAINLSNNNLTVVKPIIKPKSENSFEIIDINTYPLTNLEKENDILKRIKEASLIINDKNKLELIKPSKDINVEKSGGDFGNTFILVKNSNKKSYFFYGSKDVLVNEFDNPVFSLERQIYLLVLNREREDVVFSKFLRNGSKRD